MNHNQATNDMSTLINKRRKKIENILKIRSFERQNKYEPGNVTPKAVCDNIT